MFSLFFFFNDTATTEIYTLSLHDALPISIRNQVEAAVAASDVVLFHVDVEEGVHPDRKSTRLNSSHGYISYAVFCLKKKKQTNSDDGSAKVLIPPRALYTRGGGIRSGRED